MSNVNDDADESSNEDLWLCKKAGSDHWQPTAIPKQDTDNRESVTKEYVDSNFFCQAQIDPAKTHDYVKASAIWEESAPKVLEIGIDLHIQDDIADAAEENDADLDNGVFHNGLVTALGVKNWVEGKGYLTSAAMTNYATKNDIKDFVTKGNTLEHYGITDAVKNGGYITPDSTSPTIGFATTANGWPYQGAAMMIGSTGAGQLRLISTSGSGYRPEIFVSGRYLDNESEWARIITDKNIGTQAIALANASEHRAPTDNSAFATYAYLSADKGWYTTGPSLAFPNGNYKGLIQMTYALNNAYMRMFISGVRPEVDGNILPWTEVITEGNIASYALAMKTYQSGIDLNEIETGLYDLTGAITNSPLNYGSLLNIKGYFSAQLIFNANGDAAYYRTKSDREVDGTKWRPWRTIIDSNNVSSYVQSVADSRYLRLDSGGTVKGQIYIETSVGDRYIHSKCDTAHIAFGVGSGGNNRGIFDINDGKWWIVRNNSDYTEIVSSTMSLVGKVNVTGVLEARSGITLGSVTRTSWPTEGIAKNSILMPNNAFDNFGRIQFSQFDNALYAAAHRFNVTLNGFNTDNKTVLFNGSYEDSNKVPMGQTATIRIDNNGSNIIVGYPYGKIVLSFYYLSVPASVSVRVYSTYGTPGWYTLPLSEVRGGHGGVFVFDNTSYFNITEIEITITAKDDIEAALAEIDWFLNRVILPNLPVVTKFAVDQELYGRLICKGGITLGNKTITSWDDIKASGSVQWSDIEGAPSYYESKGLLVVNALEVGTYIKATSYITTSGYIYATSYIKTSMIGYVSTPEVITTRIYLNNDEVGITSWGDLKTILGLKALAYKDSIAFSEITSKPTTLSGYGITDAYTRAQVDALIANVEGGSGSGTGNITIDSTLSETSVNPVQNNVITANINSINASLTSVNTTLGSLRSLAYKDKVDWNTDIENIPDDLGGEIKVVSQTATSGTVGINPNVINKWGSLSGTDSFTIAFNDGEDGVANYYMIEFKMTATSPTITLPDSVVWANGYNVLENITSNRAATCQISILDGLAVGAIFYDE